MKLIGNSMTTSIVACRSAFMPDCSVTNLHCPLLTYIVFCGCINCRTTCLIRHRAVRAACHTDSLHTCVMADSRSVFFHDKQCLGNTSQVLAIPFGFLRFVVVSSGADRCATVTACGWHHVIDRIGQMPLGNAHGLPSSLNKTKKTQFEKTQFIS